MGNGKNGNHITVGKFSAVLDAVDEGILITDENGIVQFYNDSHARMDGLEKSEVIGKKVTEVYELDDDTSLVMRCIRSGGEPIINSLSIFKARHGRVVNSVSSVRPLRDRDCITGYICSVSDWEYLDGIRNPGEAIKETNEWTRDKGYVFEDIIGANQQLLHTVNRARQTANSPSPVLIYGKTGTGKELVAQSIHNASNRRHAPYLAINCAAIPEHLLESMLFGSTRGAFTGALDKKGLLEQVDGGTLLLDELNSMPYPLQAKILRVLQEKKVARIGSVDEKSLNIKVISTINVHPGKALEHRKIRQDLLYRLGVVYLEIPSLNRRKEDLPGLIEHFIAKFNEKMNKNVQSVSGQVMEGVLRYHWPGNVRELENLIESAMNLIAGEEVIQPWHLSAYSCWSDTPGSLPGETLAETGECTWEPGGGLVGLLEQYRGNLSRVARHLGVARNTLYKRLGQKGLDPKKIAADADRIRIRAALSQNRGNVSGAARDMGISRQSLVYRIQKLGLDIRAFRSRL
ncbi:MAG: sigma 54-interacting transcriptional regulator [Desulfobacter sp.]